MLAVSIGCVQAHACDVFLVLVYNWPFFLSLHVIPCLKKQQSPAVMVVGCRNPSPWALRNGPHTWNHLERQGEGRGCI